MRVPPSAKGAATQRVVARGMSPYHSRLSWLLAVLTMSAAVYLWPRIPSFTAADARREEHTTTPARPVHTSAASPLVEQIARPARLPSLRGRVQSDGGLPIPAAQVCALSASE